MPKDLSHRPNRKLPITREEFLAFITNPGKVIPSKATQHYLVYFDQYQETEWILSWKWPPSWVGFGLFTVKMGWIGLVVSWSSFPIHGLLMYISSGSTSHRMLQISFFSLGSLFWILLADYFYLRFAAFKITIRRLTSQFCGRGKFCSSRKCARGPNPISHGGVHLSSSQPIRNAFCRGRELPQLRDLRNRSTPSLPRRLRCQLLERSRQSHTRFTAPDSVFPPE